MNFKKIQAFCSIIVAAILVSFVLPGCEKEHLPDETIYFQEDILPKVVATTRLIGSKAMT